MSTKETPLARQYRQVKEKYPDTILLFRMGDFYETFADDAVITAATCGITLTKRNNGAEGDTPLAGFPHHQLDNYLPKLVRAGHRVAVCEQLEDPKQAKGIVKRGVVEVVTPGVVLYDKILDHKTNTYLGCLIPPVSKGKKSFDDKGAWGIALTDVSTGFLMAADIPFDQLTNILDSYRPAELLVNKEDKEQVEEVLHQYSQAAITKLEPWLFDVEFARTTTQRHVDAISLKGFGVIPDSLGAIAIGVVLHYVAETQRHALTQLRSVKALQTNDVMMLDPATRRNLEIHQSSTAGEREGLLIAIMDRTLCPMGGRLMRRWIQSPLTDLQEIQRRHSAVASLAATHDIRNKLGTFLSQVGDLERLMMKVVTDRANARDLNALKNGLAQLPDIQRCILSNSSIHDCIEDIADHSEIVSTISGELADDAPTQLGTGKMFRSGINAELDLACDALTNGQQWIRDYQERERLATGISSLKVSYNNVFGYYIEISKAQLVHTPVAYERKQTLANAERFTTIELKELEQTLITAGARVTELEGQMFTSLKQRVATHCDVVQQSAGAVATIDCLRSFAELAVVQEYVQPEMVPTGNLFIEGARHPVIERMLPVGTSYVPNSIALDISDRQILVITGPNMSGKSSYLRQTGLIVFLAHVGSFVPATSATIPVTDRIFTRVGAQDNIAAGESTFLVEMQEAANIIHNATHRSLILLDEVGRGTATFDGISIAWAIAEYIHEVVGAKTLFATHYHELTALADRFHRIQNVKVEVIESGADIVFTHRVVPGSADHSFGIHVAKMAGMPESIVNSATQILKHLETGAHNPATARSTQVNRLTPEPSSQMQLFEVRDDEIRTKIRSLELDSLTPLQALQALATLKESLE